MAAEPPKTRSLAQKSSQDGLSGPFVFLSVHAWVGGWTDLGGK